MTPIHNGTDMNSQPTGYSGQINPLPKLKPCPFCGADYVNLSVGKDESGDSYIYCYVCDSVYYNDKPSHDIVEMWNRRAIE